MMKGILVRLTGSQHFGHRFQVVFREGPANSWWLSITVCVG